MSSFSKSKSEVPFQNYTNHLEVESCEEELSTQYEDKEIIYKDRLPNCVEEYLEDICISNQQYMSDPKINASTHMDKIKND